MHTLKPNTVLDHFHVSFSVHIQRFSILAWLRPEFRSSHHRCSMKKVPKDCNFIKETLAQVFSCEFCEISKNPFFTEHLWTTVSNHNYSCTLENPKFLVSPWRLFDLAPTQVNSYFRKFKCHVCIFYLCVLLCKFTYLIIS